jgi:hypothetical protein
MPRIRLVIAALATIAGLLPHTSARAESAGAALIIGNATYATLPGVPACAKSANAIAAALRGLGFQVTERQDPSTGGVDAAIGEFTQHLAGGGSAGFVYMCGYATDFNDRTFVLPTSARIERPSDVLTQGVLAKSMVAPVSRGPATVGIVVFDLIPKPDGPPKLGLDALAALPVPEGIGIIAASETSPADNPTPLAKAVTAALAGPQVGTETLLASVQTQLAGSSLSIHMPARPGILAGAASPAVSPAPQAVPTPAAQASSEKLPDETSMTEADRRAVQSALSRLGYYDSQVDGLFGPETRAAIRRYQHEIGSETTGRLTADEATRLVNSH